MRLSSLWLLAGASGLAGSLLAQPPTGPRQGAFTSSFMEPGAETGIGAELTRFSPRTGIAFTDRVSPASAKEFILPRPRLVCARISPTS